jgi:hypothetical protein
MILPLVRFSKMQKAEIDSILLQPKRGESARRLSVYAGKMSTLALRRRTVANDISGTKSSCAIEYLLEARHAARNLGLDAWEFAVDLHGLRAAGITDSEVRWALVMRYVEQRVEVTTLGDTDRSFRDVANLQLTEKSCFVLTAAGEEFAKKAALGVRPHVFRRSPEEVVCRFPVGGLGLGPQWDSDCRVLRVGEATVKEYKVPAANQELILATFEELRWPPTIDDPLPPREGLDPKRRLHDTINSLNRNQQRCLLKFRGKGDGQGVSWEFHHIPTRLPPDPV